MGLDSGEALVDAEALCRLRDRLYILESALDAGNPKYAIVGGEATGLLAPLTWVIGQVLSMEIVQDLRVKIES